MADRPAPDLEPEVDGSRIAPVDDQVYAQVQAIAQELFESRRFAVQLGIERQHLRDAIDTLRVEANAAARREMAAQIEAALQQRDRARSERDGLFAERDAVIGERDSLIVACETLIGERDGARAMLERVTSSTAWRLTGPGRRILQKLLGR